MKIITMAIILSAGLAVSGCWDNEKERRASQFMSGLTRCDDCAIDKPLIGGKKEEAQ